MAVILINEQKKKGHINPEIQGQFSEHLGRGIYEGLFVRPDSGIENVNGMRTDVVNALKEMKVPLLRWPGGCFADEYHWKDGIGPKESRKKMINTHWGGVLEDNSFGTHEYFELVKQLGCKSYINGNLGSGTVQEMSEWIEYMTFDGLSPMTELRKANGHEEPWRVDYFGVGHENWGSATEFDREMFYQTMEKTLYTEDLLKMHGDILDTYDPEKKIGFSFDEWGGWYECEPGTNPGFLYQQNTMRDALIAGTTLNIFNRHCDRVKLACLAQMINVIQSVILTDGEKMILTPTYHVFHMYKDHQDGELLDSMILENEEAGTEQHPVPALNESVSEKDGVITVTIANMDAEHGYPVSLKFNEKKPSSIEARVVSEEMHAKNTFEKPNVVSEKALDGVELTENGCSFRIPPCAVVKLTIR